MSSGSFLLGNTQTVQAHTSLDKAQRMLQHIAHLKCRYRPGRPGRKEIHVVFAHGTQSQGR